MLCCSGQIHFLLRETLCETFCGFRLSNRLEGGRVDTPSKPKFLITHPDHLSNFRKFHPKRAAHPGGPHFFYLF
ncbi:hypothetical protein CLOSTMETH_01152 [[Clostridium] methylpentosum DSM 5476]|uniref:Uncharacterized protein n=1 Tax=[Clostridium] methylpentosum DSM 5476 TaxID=537013 RepID=C0EBD4_9FIRM|nr:hypothetical protein CLOSTMETH_01152 [[Clostridium] methylpentosum DSM 5476]